MHPDVPLKVTVLVMTYNHAGFIAQALDSVLTQRTGFHYEILISEDRSTDGTRETVISYAEKHPGRIRLLLSERNLHSNTVVSRGIRVARGEYVALLDGDDYWVSPDKLQKQVDFLDAHPEIAAEPALPPATLHKLLAAAALSTRPMRDVADAVPDLHAAIGAWSN